MQSFKTGAAAPTVFHDKGYYTSAGGATLCDLSRQALLCQLFFMARGTTLLVFQAQVVLHQ